MSQEMWLEFCQNRTKIEAFALRRGQKSRLWLARRGQDTGELETEALVNHAWERALDGPSPWKMESKSCLQYFVEQIHNRVRYFEQRASFVHLSIVDEQKPATSEISASRVQAEAIVRANNDDDILELQLERRNFMAFVERSDPGMLTFARLAFDGAPTSYIDRHFGFSRATRTRRFQRYRALLAEFQKAILACDERLNTNSGEC
jgi:hypothetical protein